MNLTCVCVDCNREYALNSGAWRCECGGLFDLKGMQPALPLDQVQRRAATMWRYEEVLPFVPGERVWQEVTLGEGYTPLVPLAVNSPHVLMKVDYMMPTLSFKDRGAAVLIAKAKQLGVTHVIADSSGNAGTSIAAYAARAGMACDVYVPSNTPPKKLKQIAAHGATIHAIPGSRENTAAAAMAAVEREGAFYASHVYNPLFHQGTKTYAYEVWEQLGGRAPDVLVVPVGNGTLLLGAYHGFRELQRAGMIERMPRFLAVQAEPCAPLAKAWRQKRDDVQAVVNEGTAADGIAIAAPARGRQILQAVRETRGALVAVPEEAIERARAELAERGFYVEPTSACTYAGFVEYVTHYLGDAPDGEQEPLFAGNPLLGGSGETVVIPLCGAGIKV